MIYKATLNLCLVVVGLAGVLAIEESRSSQFSRRIEPARDEAPATNGVCNRTTSEHYVFTGTKTFSVYDNDADLSSSPLNISAPVYANYQNCLLVIVNDEGYPRLKVEVIINSEDRWDNLYLSSGYYHGTFNGRGYKKETLVLPTNALFVQWTTDSNVEETLGFSLKVTGTYDPATTDDDTIESVTTGICRRSSDHYILYSAKTFSVYDNKEDLSSNELNISAPIYDNNEYCIMVINSRIGLPRLKAEVTINSENDYDYLYLSSGNYIGTFTGLGFKRQTIVLPNNLVYVQWKADGVFNYELGFSLRLSGTDEPATEDNNVL